MGDVRTQEHRYWIQIENEPKANLTGYTHIDLNLVQGVMPTYDGGKLTSVVIFYPPIPGALKLENQPMYQRKTADFFLAEWEKFITMQARDDRAKPGLIQTASNTIDLPTQN